MSSRYRRARLPVLAITSWLLVLPALMVLTLSLVRAVQPAQREPARTAATILAWISGQMTPTTVAMVFIALPVLALAVGAMALAARWQAEPKLRADVMAVGRLLRDNLTTSALAAATFLAAAVLAAVTGHLIAG